MQQRGEVGRGKMGADDGEECPDKCGEGAASDGPVIGCPYRQRAIHRVWHSRPQFSHTIEAHARARAHAHAHAHAQAQAQAPRAKARARAVVAFKKSQNCLMIKIDVPALICTEANTVSSPSRCVALSVLLFNQILRDKSATDHTLAYRQTWIDASFSVFSSCCHETSEPHAQVNQAALTLSLRTLD
ncbi:uncharacterized protein UHO2_06521 [Ustilago hordei]|uniref:Uncharacterized protein n=1 Tax=Ustilago hordei TaxID=120017 RepID=I2FV47_USTHO|nr:uncharacterized protein UHO2_06521 [Ustilago hordei]CCF50790.1 uncharacterized protein UHOR_06370 [Ustilago hordei]SYW77224.1 uncharacterized protein UHO2_06521 [Ustilago hordei]